MNDSANDANHPETDRPAGPVDNNLSWGSDVAAQMLRRMDIHTICDPDTTGGRPAGGPAGGPGDIGRGCCMG